MPATDIAIAGAGPAGLSAALSLKQLTPHARVSVFDLRRADRWRPAETLSPAARKILESLGCWDAFCAGQFPPSFGSRAVWGSDEPYENEFLFSLHGNGWHVDRERFDAMLARCAIAAGVELRHGERFDARASFVIDATGRQAAIATKKGAALAATDALVGVFATLEISRPLDSYTLVEAQEDGWWYSAPIGPSRAIAAWMSDADLVRAAHLRDERCWTQKLSCAPFTSARLQDARPEHSPRIHAAQSQRLTPLAGDDWVAAGDAAMTFDPLSSQGIVKALRSGKLASFVAFDHLQGRPPSQARYTTIANQEYAAYEKAHRKFYSEERRWPGAPFWSRRR